LRDGAAPSYFVECLLFNVPNAWRHRPRAEGPS
jgi:hypothetical protein